MFVSNVRRKRLSGSWLGWLFGMVLAGVIAAPEARPAPIGDTVEFDCVIEPQQVVKLASPVVGVISHLDVDRGDIVRQGQVVGGLEDGVEAAAVALARARSTNEFPIRSAEARLRYLRSEHERLLNLQSKDVVSRAALQKAAEEANVAEQQFEEAKLNKEIAGLQLKQAEEVLAQRKLQSPIDASSSSACLFPASTKTSKAQF